MQAGLCSNICTLGRATLDMTASTAIVNMCIVSVYYTIISIGKCAGLRTGTHLVTTHTADIIVLVCGCNIIAMSIGTHAVRISSCIAVAAPGKMLIRAGILRNGIAIISARISTLNTIACVGAIGNPYRTRTNLRKRAPQVKSHRFCLT